MAQFNLNWSNTPILSNSNVVSQLASYRQKAVGGAYITTGFTPSNPLAKSVVAAQSPIVSNNSIWEFKIESICTVGGPTLNTNGVIEGIDFICITPSLSTDTTSATITVDLTNTDITKVNFVLKKTSDNSIVGSSLTVTRASNAASRVVTGLTSNTSYYWQVYYFATINGVEVISTDVTYIGTTCGNYTTVTAVAQDLIWIPLAKVCEKAGKFNVFKTITGLSSPFVLASDPTFTSPKRVWVADSDSTSGNLYYFNPDTATTLADMTYSPAIVDPNIYGAYFDMPNRRLYMIGKNTGGMKVINIDTNAVSTVAFGTDGVNFSRLTLLVSGNRIYCSFKSGGTNDIIIIDRTTLAIVSTVPVSGIPNNTRFALGGFSLIPVNNEIWVTAGAGSSVAGIGVYDADLTTNIANITFTGAAFWDFAKYWGGGFFDATSNQFYAYDIGSSQRFVIDATSHAILNQRIYTNRQGKSYAYHQWNVDPVTNELYVTVNALNNSFDTPLVSTLVEDRSTFQYSNLFDNVAVPAFVRVLNTTVVVSPYGGLQQWSGGAWATDGRITFLDSSTTGGNTGNQIVLTLQEVDHNNSDTPTGPTKNNTLGDPDYVPPQSNLTDCPITYDLSCPSSMITTYAAGTLQYEFAIPTSVAYNPGVAKMRITPYNLTTTSVEGTPVIVNSVLPIYNAGSFTGLGGTSYQLRVEYLNSSDTVLATCTAA